MRDTVAIGLCAVLLAYLALSLWFPRGPAPACNAALLTVECVRAIR